MATAPKACPHAPVEASFGWVCKVCGHRLLERVPVGWVTWWGERRRFRRAINEWERGKQA